MLLYHSKLIGTPVLSVQTGSAIAYLDRPIVDPDNLKIIAFYLSGPATNPTSNILSTSSIREYSQFGIVIDSADEIIAKNDVVKIQKIIDLNFNLIGLKVETKKGTKLGKITDFTLSSDDFLIQQIVVKRPAIKSFIDPELLVHRREITEVTDYKVVVKDEEKVLKARAEQEDFVPNFVNPFRTQEPGFAPADVEKSEKTD